QYRDCGELAPRREPWGNGRMSRREDTLSKPDGKTGDWQPLGHRNPSPLYPLRVNRQPQAQPECHHGAGGDEGEHGWEGPLPARETCHGSGFVRTAAKYSAIRLRVKTYPLRSPRLCVMLPLSNGASRRGAETAEREMPNLFGQAGSLPHEPPTASAARAAGFCTR